MSLPNYTKKTKPALWTQVAYVAKQRKDLEAALKLHRAVMREARKAQKRSTTLRNQRKAALSGVGRAKVSPRTSKRLKSRSSAMAAKMKEYLAAKGRYLADYPSCQCGCGRKSKEVHHRFGRNGDLLLWKTGWLAVCVDCHLWIHSHIDLARERNLIALPGEWNNKKVIDKQPACA